MLSNTDQVNTKTQQIQQFSVLSSSFQKKSLARGQQFDKSKPSLVPNPAHQLLPLSHTNNHRATSVQTLAPRPTSHHLRSCFTCKKSSSNGSASSVAGLSGSLPVADTGYPESGILVLPAETFPSQHLDIPVHPSHRFNHLHQEEKSRTTLQDRETETQRSSLIICFLYFYLLQALTLLKPCTYTSVLHR